MQGLLSLRRMQASGDMPLSALECVRVICLGFPGAIETTSFGHPTWKAGSKAFAVFEKYRGDWSLALKADPGEQRALIDVDERFYRTPLHRPARLGVVQAAGAHPLRPPARALARGSQPGRGTTSIAKESRKPQSIAPSNSTMSGGTRLKSLYRIHVGRTRMWIRPGQLSRSRPSGHTEK